MNFKTITLFTFLLLSSIFSFAQDSGNNMYDASILHEIRFEFPQPNYWQTLINNYENNFDPFDTKPYLMGKVTIDGEVVDSVGVRFKGFTSYPYTADKKPIKVDFNEFVPGQRYDGLRKLNLNNSTGDPSMHRDVVCYDLHRSIGVNAPRTSFSKVYFNDEYWGLYQTVEQVDKEFLQNNFSNDEGNLFKNLAWSKFEWNGPNVSSYNNIFSLKTNQDINDWSGFINLMDVLNNTPDAEFKTAIEEIFNVDLFLKTLAVDVATNNWDSYLEHGRNWYIYEDTNTGIFHWIPWDYNFSLPGGGSGLGTGGTCEIFPAFVLLSNGTPSVKFFDYSFGSIDTYAWDFGDGNTSDEKDPEHTYAMAGTYEVCLTISNGPDCDESICENINTDDDLGQCASILDGTCPHPVGQTFATVLTFNPTCCEIWGDDCEDLYGWFSGSGDGFGSGDYAIDQRENEGVLINRLLNEPEFFERYLDFQCSLLNNHFTTDKYHSLIDQNKILIEDAVQSDPNLLSNFNDFINDIGDEGLKMIIADRIDSLKLELNTLTECMFAPIIAVEDVAINELVASNDSTSLIVDANGESDDWIELYNNTSANIDLSDSYLSDDPSDLLKWQFPNGTMIDANGYLIIWADKDEDQPGLHCNFKLSKSGEQVILSNADGTNIDNIEFAEQDTNIAFARSPNGTGDFTFKTSTFNANNDTGSVSTDDWATPLKVNIYPVPATDYLQIDIHNKESNEYVIDLFSIAGQKIFSNLTTSSNKARLDLSTIKSGFYFLNIRDNEGNNTAIKFIKTE